LINEDGFINVEVGDWIHAQEIHGHVVVGYIDRIELSDHTALVYVTHDCCGKLMGKRAWIDMNHAVKLDNTKSSDIEGYLMAAIDVALDTKDRRWFLRLTNELRKLKNPEPPKNLYAVQFRLG
jgi:hypothetical protein